MFKSPILMLVGGVISTTLPAILNPETAAHYFKQLKGDDVRRTLKGKTVKYLSDVVPSGEEFDSNGDWIGSITARVPLTFSGSWFIRGDAICVVARDVPVEFRSKIEGCRSVWKDEIGKGFLITHFLYREKGLMRLRIAVAPDWVAQRCVVLNLPALRHMRPPPPECKSSQHR